MQRSIATKRTVTLLAIIGLLLASPFITPAIGGMTFWGPLHDEKEFELSNPWGLATDELGNIYVADTGNHRVVKFSPRLSPLWRTGAFGAEPGQFSGPTGVAYGNDQIYVADTHNHRIQIYSTGGDYRGTFGTRGNGEGQLGYPTGIAFGDNSVWVTEGGANCRVSRFTPSGSFISKFGSCGTGNGQFYSPGGITVTYAYVYVADQGSPRVQRFALSGEFLLSFGTYGEGDGQFHNPDGIVAIEGADPTADGSRVFVVDAGPNSRVQEFTEDGKYVSEFGGTGDTHFSYPHGIAVSDDGSKFYVSDTGGTSNVWEFRDEEPELFSNPRESSKQVIRTEGVWITLEYNQLDKSCNALAKATLSIPGHPSFTVQDDFKVTNVLVSNKVDLSAKQADWFKKAIDKKKKVPTSWKLTAQCTGNVRLTKTHRFQFAPS